MVFPAGPRIKVLLEFPRPGNCESTFENFPGRTKIKVVKECWDGGQVCFMGVVTKSPSAEWAELSRVHMNSRISTLVYIASNLL